MNKDLELLNEVLRDAGLLTPAIAGVIGIIKGGREQGKSDEDIKAESMQLARATKERTEIDMGSQA